jgi:hypothetical protein
VTLPTVVREYLDSKRIIDERPVGPLVPMYEEIFAACVRRLDLNREAPGLHVTRTAQAASETLRLASGQTTVVYDQYQGRVNHRMNRFALEEFPTDLITRFFLRHVRITLYDIGEIPAALYAGALLDEWPPEGGSSPEPPNFSREQTRQATVFQETFVIAHELAHLALRIRPASPELSRMVDEVVARISASSATAHEFDGYLAPAFESDRRAGRAAILGEPLASAIAASNPPAPVDYREIAEIGSDLATYLVLHPQIREEALCDLLASRTVMDVFNPQPGIAILGILLCLWNQTTLALMRQRIYRIFDGSASDDHPDRSIMPLAIRGWFLGRVWGDLIRRNESDEAAALWGEILIAQRERHDARVRSIAEAVPFLIFRAQKEGLLSELGDESWRPLEVRHRVLVEMGADGPSASP